MRSADVYPSKYLKAEELEQPTTVTIEKVVMESLESKDRGKQDKPVIYFKEVEKGLVVNKTNWSTIAKQHGDESDDWIGKQITLFAMDVEAFGEMVLSIRVMAPRKHTTKTSPPSPVTASTPPPAVEAPDEVTQFWSECRLQGVDRKEALAFLKTCNNDFKLALTKLLEGGNDLPF